VQATSTREQLLLAQHLQKTGAKFFGAYWCRFCGQQREMFGADATRALPYVECASDGYNTAASVCGATPGVKGYPTWQIGGQFYGGLRSLDELARLSGFTAASEPEPAVDFADVTPLRMGDDCKLDSPSKGKGKGEDCS